MVDKQIIRGNLLSVVPAPPDSADNREFTRYISVTAKIKPIKFHVNKSTVDGFNSYQDVSNKLRVKCIGKVWFNDLTKRVEGSILKGVQFSLLGEVNCYETPLVGNYSADMRYNVLLRFI